MTADLEGLKRLYEEYLTEARQAEAKLRPLDGFLGLGRKNSDDPCHGRFTERLETLLKSAAEENPGSAELRAMLSYIYRAPKENPEPPVAYWTLMAVHGLTPELAGQLCREDAEALWEEYRAAYPRRERLPAQKKALSALDAARK